MIDLTPILQAVIGIIATVITCFLVPFIKSKVSVEKQAEMESWVNIAVLAAEQLYRGSGRGEEKKNYVLNFLIEKGFNVYTEKLMESVNALIEAAVYEIKK